MKHSVVERRDYSTWRILVLIFLISAASTAAINVALISSGWRQKPEVAASEQVIQPSQPEPIPSPSILPATEQPTPPANPSTSTQVEASIKAEFEQLSKDYPAAQFGLAFVPLGDGASVVAHDGHSVFRSASLYKTLAAYRVLQRVDAGELQMSMVANCIELAITVSDNDCGIELQRLAEPYLTDKLLPDMGMPNTSVSGYFPQTTAIDQIKLYQTIYNGDGLSDTSHAFLMQALLGQTILDRIPIYTQPASVYHKTGDLGSEVHAASIISRPDQAYILVVLSRDWEIPLSQRYQAISNLALSVDTIVTTNQ